MEHGALSEGDGPAGKGRVPGARLLLGGLASSLVLALGALAAARYITSPRWIDALAVTGGALGLGGALAVGLLARRLWRRWKPAAALVLALAAAAARAYLLEQLAQDPLAGVTVDFLRLGLASSTVVWGLLALVWGALVIQEAQEERAGGRKRGRSTFLPLAAGAAAVTLALYSVAPLAALAGLTLNHWTLLGLLALAATAHLAGLLWRRLSG